MSNPSPFKWRHFEAEIILLCVRWYLRYALSYRDLEEMMTERGLSVDHSTIYRWVQRYAPELEKRCRVLATLDICSKTRESTASELPFHYHFALSMMREREKESHEGGSFLERIDEVANTAEASPDEQT